MEGTVLSADLSKSDLIDASSLVEFERVVSLSLQGNPLLGSCEGIPVCRHLWWLDLRDCNLGSVEPLLQLGALGVLKLSGNQLGLPAALQLRQMFLGQLEVRNNPLLPVHIRSELRARDEASDSMVLRSLLVDSLPLMLCLDGSFITCAERAHCRRHFRYDEAGAAGRSILLEAIGDISLDQDLGVDVADVQQSQAPQAESLIELLSDVSALQLVQSVIDDATQQKYEQADLARLRWLAADHDSTVALKTSPAQGTPGKGKLPPVSLTEFCGKNWLAGARQLGMMALLAFSLHKSIPRR